MNKTVALLLLASCMACASSKKTPGYPMTIYVCSEAEVESGSCPVDTSGKDCAWYTDVAGVRVLSCQGVCVLKEKLGTP